MSARNSWISAGCQSPRRQIRSNSLSGTAVASLAVVLAGAVSGSAAVITGDPGVDSGWTAGGMSASAGTYVDGAGNYNVQIYSTAFILGASSPLISTLGGFDWNAGDTIVGVGGVYGGANTDLTYSGGADENGVSHTGATSTRIVIKYGTATNTWTAPGSGTLANGGVGSVLLGTYPYDFYPADAGTLIVPADSPEEQTGAGSSAFVTISGDVGRVITDWSSGAEIGFESFMDLTLLEAKYPTTEVALGNKFDLDLQRGTGNPQDSLGTLPSSVPEPASLSLLGIGAGSLMLRRRRQV
jgi:PEP-CTERM motif